MKQIFSVFLTLSILLFFFLCGFWIFQNPLPHGWDETAYLNRAFWDYFNYQKWNAPGLIISWLREDVSRPPAMRILIAPFTLAFGVHIQLLRFVSLFYTLETFLFVFLTAKRFAGKTAALFAVSFLAFCPVFIYSVVHYGTEFPLYLATAALLYALLRRWDRPVQPYNGWVGIALALILGSYAKATFFLIAPAMLIAVWILSERKIIQQPKPKDLLKAVLFTSIFTTFWWGPNFRAVFKNLQYAAGYERHFILTGRGFTENLEIVLREASGFFTGPPLAILALMLTGSFLSKLLRRNIKIETKDKLLFTVCLCAIAPLIVLFITGGNQNFRYPSPALIPLAVMLAVFAEKAGWFSHLYKGSVLLVFLFYQIAALSLPFWPKPPDFFSPQLMPTSVFSSFQSWNWSKLRRLCLERNLQNPRVAYLGNASALNQEQIQYPWAREGQKIKVKWLWRYEDGNIDWPKIEEDLKNQDVALTALALPSDSVDKQYRDNVHNWEFLKRMRQHPDFRGPVLLRMDRQNSQPVHVFFRRKIAH